MTTSADATIAAPTSDKAALRQAWKVFGATSLGLLLTFLNSSSLQVALPTLTRAFDASPAAASWILLSYMLANTVCILAFGRLSDIIGRRRLYIAGLIVFLIGCLASAFAPNVPTLIALRVLQGVGAAAIIANNAALLTDAFPRASLGTALGLNATVAAIAQVCGPAFGGAVVSLFGWQAAFLYNLPFGLIGLLLAFKVIRPMPPRPKERFDLLGSLLSAAALAGFVMALSLGSTQGWTSPLALSGALLAVLAFPAFLLSQVTRPHPLLDLAMFRDGSLSVAFAGVLVTTSALTGSGLITALYLQSVQGLDAFAAGTRVMAMAVGMAAAAQIVSRLMRRIPAAVLGATGLSIIAAAQVTLLLSLSPHTPGWLVGLLLFLIGFGNTCYQTPCTNFVMLRVPAERRGVANGIRSTLQNTGMLTGTALSVALAATILPHGLKERLYGAASGALTASEAAMLIDGFRLSLGVLAVSAAASALAMLETARRNRPKG